MKILFSIFIMLFCVTNILSQNIKQIAAYDNYNSYTSGIYAITDTSVMRYSWYYQEWFPLSVDGLTLVNGKPVVNNIAVYNNVVNNSSGLFVFSDTLVMNYNWILSKWLALSNDGLPRINDKPDVRMLSVYGDSGSSSNSTLLALSSEAVYRYSWYFSRWDGLSMNGLISKTEKINSSLTTEVYPNPFTDKVFIKSNNLFQQNNQVDIALFDIKGNLIKNIQKIVPLNNNEFDLDIAFLPEGLYLLEIKINGVNEIVRIIKIKN